MNNKIFKCTGISKTFKQGVNSIEVLKNINFQLENSSSAGILGPSGSGKTTLLHILAGLDSPSSGEVLFMNDNLNKISENKKAFIRNHEIGFVYQFHHLLPEFTALENVSMPMLISGSDNEDSFKKSEELLKKLNLHNRMDHKPSEMSGGERQRVAIARSLSNSPSCLIMDEPTGDLDAYNEKSVIEVILRLVEDFNVSLIIATHNDNFSKKLDKTYNLKSS
tara:strand:+ start:270 stop:935 length:666 start_codon:yes stop_codon:yes gene_type:complete